MFTSLVDKRFGKLTVVEVTDIISLSDGSVYKCVCDCGNTVDVSSSKLISKNVTDCNCTNNSNVITLEEEASIIANNQFEYKIWLDIIKRCYSTTHAAYDNYGGKGIKVCDEWRKSFSSFIKDMGPKTNGTHVLSRKDTRGNYELNNCVWKTRAHVAGSRRNNATYEYKGQHYTVYELSLLPEVQKLNLTPSIIRNRLTKLKWSVDEALTIEKGGGYKKSEHNYTFDGKTKTLSEWADTYGILYQTLYCRLVVNKMDFEEAVKSPKNTRY